MNHKSVFFFRYKSYSFHILLIFCVSFSSVVFIIRFVRYSLCTKTVILTEQVQIHNVHEAADDVQEKEIIWKQSRMTIKAIHKTAKTVRRK
jgi:hypothetical protein